jgi:hypothetical protein
VRQEIQAAGKWPQALVEIPKAEETVKNDDAKTNDAKKVEPIKVDEADKSDDDPIGIGAGVEELLEKAIERGRAEGVAIGKADALNAIEESMRTITAKLTQSEKNERKIQSAYDVLSAKYEALKKSCDEQVKVLTAKLDEVTAKNQKFLAGALSFSPDVMTWAEAIRACAGSYEQAAKKYPELRKAFIEQNKK